MRLRKIIKYLIFLIPWFLTSFANINNDFYKTLNLPFFAPPAWLFPIVWTIIFILIAYSIYLVYDDSEKNYKVTLLINYILNQSFNIVFFLLKNLFFGFVTTLAVFISTLYLYEETNNINKKAAKYLIPYIIWSLFATFLSLVIYFLNSNL